MALMNLNIDGVLTVEKVVVPADGITVLGHSLFRGEKIIVRYSGDELTRGQDFIPDRIDDRLYFQKNVCLFTVLKILNENLFGKEIEVEYFACGDYINAEIWNEYPSVASLKQSLASKVDNSDYIKEVKRIDGDINAEATARKEADNALQDNINTETNLRVAEDEKLQTNIDKEATARADADNALQDNINKEAAARESADNEIRNELSSETNLRLAGDAALQEKIDAEMSTRAENDSSLQTQISDLKTKFESFVPGLTYKVVSALPTADILNDVIYLVPADSTDSQNVYNEYIYIDGDWELIGTTATTHAITVDSALSATSTNPVQNKVIYNALDRKLDRYARAEEALKVTCYTNTRPDDDDTPSWWARIGSCVYTDTTGLSFAPNATIFNMTNGGEVQQIAVSFGGGMSGKFFTRSGSVSSNVWNSGWVEFQKRESGKGLSSNDYTTAEKTKLSGIAEGANKYLHPTYTARTGVPTANLTPAFGGTFTVTQPVSDSTGHVKEMNSRTVKIPNTLATESLAGLLSSADKLKLNNMGYASGPGQSIFVESYIVIITIANLGGYYYANKSVKKDGVTMSADVNFGTISAGKVTIVTGTNFNLKTRDNGGMCFIYFKG